MKLKHFLTEALDVVYRVGCSKHYDLKSSRSVVSYKEERKALYANLSLTEALVVV